MQVRDTVLALEDAGAQQLDLLGSGPIEQPAALAEDDQDDVELKLVQHAGGEREPGNARRGRARSCRPPLPSLGSSRS